MAGWSPTPRSGQGCGGRGAVGVGRPPQTGRLLHRVLRLVCGRRRRQVTGDPGVAPVHSVPPVQTGPRPADVGPIIWDLGGVDPCDSSPVGTRFLHTVHRKMSCKGRLKSQNKSFVFVKLLFMLRDVEFPLLYLRKKSVSRV